MTYSLDGTIPRTNSAWAGVGRKIFAENFQHILLWIKEFKKLLIERRAFALGRRLPTLLSNLALFGTGSRPSRINEFRTRISLGVGEMEYRFRGLTIGEYFERFLTEDFELFAGESELDLSGVLSLWTGSGDSHVMVDNSRLNGTIFDLARTGVKFLFDLGSNR